MIQVITSWGTVDTWILQLRKKIGSTVQTEEIDFLWMIPN